MTVTADDLDSVISCVMSGLLPITDRDWSVRAGTLEWDCWHTAEHIGDCLMSYAWQLAVQPTGRYVRAIATAEKDASPAEVLEFAVTGGRVLASMVRTSRAHVRAYHPAGMADPEGFAGMGCHEALLHGNDIAQAFSLSLDPHGGEVVVTTDRGERVKRTSVHCHRCPPSKRVMGGRRSSRPPIAVNAAHARGACNPGSWRRSKSSCAARSARTGDSPPCSA